MRQTSGGVTQLFLNGASERQLSQKQVTWLQSVLNQEDNQPTYAGGYTFNDADNIYGLKANRVWIKKKIEK